MKLRAQGMLNEEKLDEADDADAVEHNPADHGGCKGHWEQRQPWGEGRR